MHRPVVGVACALVAGVLAARFGLFPGILIPLALAVSGLLLASLPFHLARIQPAGIAVTFFALGVLAWQVRHGGLPGDDLCRAALARPGVVWTLEGRVRRAQLLRPDDDYITFVVDVDRVSVGKAVVMAPGRVEARWSRPGGPVFVDERVRIAGPLQGTLGEVNFDVNGYEDYLRRLGVHTAMRLSGPSAVQRIAPGRWWKPAYWASRFRFAQAERLSRAIPEEALPFVMAVWLGDSFTAGPEVYDLYVESGTAHIFSVSGLHMAIIYASAALALRTLIRRRRVRICVCLGAVFAYALLTGAQVACLRSAIMISIYLVAEMLDREPDGPTALSLAAIGFLLYNADLLFDIGFQLSFLSIASIMLYAEPMADRMERLPHWLGGSLATTFSAQILPLPVALYTFHVLPLFAPLANLLVVPLLTVVLWLCFATSFTALFSTTIASIFGHALWPAVAAIHGLATGVVALPGSSLRLTNPTLFALFFYAVAALALLAALKPGHKQRGWMRVAVGAAAMTVALWHPMTTMPAEIVFLDVGHGDASFIRTAGGSTVLIDGGNRTDTYDQGRRVVAPFLWARHVARLDYVVGSHEDSDHIGGLSYVLKHFRVGCLLLPPNPEPDDGERNLLALCRQRGVPVRRVIRGDTIMLAGATLEALHPSAAWPMARSQNDGSLVLRLLWDGPSVLFPGDVESAAEGALAKLGCASDVVKSPHHGSKTSSSQRFLEAVHPAHAIVSTGSFRGHESAKPEVMQRYTSLRIRLWRTDYLGAIRLRPHDSAYTLSSAREQRGYPRK